MSLRALILVLVAFVGCAGGTTVDMTEDVDRPAGEFVYVLGAAPEERPEVLARGQQDAGPTPDAATELAVPQEPRLVATGLPLTLLTCDGDTAYWVYRDRWDVMRTDLLDGATSLVSLAVVPSPVSMFMGDGDVVLQGFRMVRVAPETGRVRYEAAPHNLLSAPSSTGYVWYDGQTLWWAGPPLHTIDIGSAEALAPAIYEPRWIHDGRLYGLAVADGRPEIQGVGGRFVTSRGVDEIDLGVVWGSELGLHWLRRDGSQVDYPESTSLVAASGDTVARRVDGRILTRNLRTGAEEGFVEPGNVIALAACGSHAVWATADGRVTSVEMP